MIHDFRILKYCFHCLDKSRPSCAGPSTAPTASVLTASVLTASVLTASPRVSNRLRPEPPPPGSRTASAPNLNCAPEPSFSGAPTASGAPGDPEFCCTNYKFCIMEE